MGFKQLIPLLESSLLYLYLFKSSLPSFQSQRNHLDMIFITFMRGPGRAKDLKVCLHRVGLVQFGTRVFTQVDLAANSCLLTTRGSSLKVTGGAPTFLMGCNSFLSFLAVQVLLLGCLLIVGLCILLLSLLSVRSRQRTM